MSRSRLSIAILVGALFASVLPVGVAGAGAPHAVAAHIEFDFTTSVNSSGDLMIHVTGDVLGSGMLSTERATFSTCGSRSSRRLCSVPGRRT